MAEDEKSEGKEGDEGDALIKNYEKAGRIAAEISQASRKLVMPGASLLDIAESIEKMIGDAGAKPGFPVNISINDVAAHYTPEVDCEAVLGEKDIVKIDLGVHVEGCVGDIAYTIDLSDENGKLLEASEAALAAAAGILKAGITTGDVGAAVEEEIVKRGFKPIENLTGHMLAPYRLHSGVDVPNVKVAGGYKFKEGDVFAIEPFATNGAGRVKDTSQVEILSLEQVRNVRMRQSREIIAFVEENFLTLPFAERWLGKKFPSKLMRGAALKELMNAGVLHPYPVLREANGGLVSQAEHTFLIEKGGARILTK